LFPQSLETQGNLESGEIEENEEKYTSYYSPSDGEEVRNRRRQIV